MSSSSAASPARPERTWLKVLAVLLLGIAALTAATTVPVAEAITAMSLRLRETGAPGLLLFTAAYVLSTTLLMPGSLLTLVAGFAYGPLMGVLVALPAATLGATVAFALGRTLLRDWVSRRVARVPTAAAINAAVERRGFTVVLLLRLSPLVPFNALNYALSVSQVSARSYVLATAIGMLPGCAFYVFIGSLAPAAAALSAMPDRAIAPGWYVAGLAALIGVLAIVTRTARRALAAEVTSAGETHEGPTSSGVRGRRPAPRA